MSKPKWDLTSINSLNSATEWIRSKSGAIVVLAIRAEDVSVAVDPQCAPTDAGALISGEIAAMVAFLKQKREKQREAERRRKQCQEEKRQAEEVKRGMAIAKQINGGRCA